MNQTLYIGRGALDAGPASLRQVLLDHVQDERAAATILRTLARACDSGDVSHCVVFSETGSNWKVKIAYSSSREPSAGGRAAGVRV